MTTLTENFNNAYLLLGSNTGDRHVILEKTLEEIENKVGKVISVSSIFETEPWGNIDQPPFLNQAVLVHTSLDPKHLLSTLINIEKAFGRERKERWAARTLDIDILYFNREIVVTPDLKIPHPELHNRNFVLIPLNQIAPDYIHPVFNVSTAELLKRSKDTLGVIKQN